MAVGLYARLHDRLTPDGDCLVWTGGQNGRGYGQIGLNYRKLLVHRVAYEEAFGPIPEGAWVDHVCWNRLCCKPEHLRLATPSENGRNRSTARHDSGTGVRNVRRTPNGRFHARIRAFNTCYGHTWDTLEEAAAEARFLEQAFFGDYAGKG